MPVTAIIQARMASGRLPGKAVLPLNGLPVIKHNIRRAQSASIIDEVIVATTFHKSDDLIKEYATEAGAKVYRGSEDDVLGRLYRASKETNDDVIVRLTGDNPLVPTELIDEVGKYVLNNSADYASNKIQRTFPLGMDAEALTLQSLAEVHEETRDPYYREHATKYFREEKNEFEIQNVAVNDVYGESISGFSPNIRLTLDEANDYELFNNLYEKIPYETILDARETVEFIIEKDLQKINSNVDQNTL